MVATSARTRTGLDRWGEREIGRRRAITWPMRKDTVETRESIENGYGYGYGRASRTQGPA